MPKKKDQKPYFACKKYPKCPKRIGVVHSVIEEADEEESLPATTHSHFVDVSGPCEEECWVKSVTEPINHSVLLVTSRGVTDIGS